MPVAHFDLDVLSTEFSFPCTHIRSTNPYSRLLKVSARFFIPLKLSFTTTFITKKIK
jgi:hypothetical protein